ADHAFSSLKVQRLTLHEVSVIARERSLHMPSIILVRTVASISIGGVSQKSLVNHCLDGFWSHVVWVGVVNRGVWSSSGPADVSGVPVDRSHAHTHDHDGSEALDESPDSILLNEPKPRGKHRPPPPPSIRSLGESSYPP
ncbi:hypothetical protein Tco_0061383, partial [Tanacetum coccineum]